MIASPIVPPLCIIQARYNSSRLPAKMLVELGGETLIARGHRLACEAFGRHNVVVGIPRTDASGPLRAALDRLGATVYVPPYEEADVLSRMWWIAHTLRWHPDAVIVRWTPDDPFKEPALCRRVAAGERVPVELGAEAFTLSMLDHAHRTVTDPFHREHISYALFPQTLAPSAPAGRPWSIDTTDDVVVSEALGLFENVAADRPPL